MVNVTVGAMTAALYVVLTYASAAFGLASGAVQIRLSEALTVLPMFSPAAIPGLLIGCVLANTLTGCALWDVVFGSLATLIGAVGTYLLKKHKIFALVPPIAANTVIVPLVLTYVYMTDGAFWYFCLTVGLGEIISCGVLGSVLRKGIERTDLKFTKK